MIPRIQVSSSMIKEMGYQNGTVAVQFNNGSVYHYQNVPPEVYQAVIGAQGGSVGQTFNAKIKGQYSSIKVE